MLSELTPNCQDLQRQPHQFWHLYKCHNAPASLWKSWAGSWNIHPPSDSKIHSDFDSQMSTAFCEELKMRYSLYVYILWKPAKAVLLTLTLLWLRRGVPQVRSGSNSSYSQIVLQLQLQIQDIDSDWDHSSGSDEDEDNCDDSDSELGSTTRFQMETRGAILRRKTRFGWITIWSFKNVVKLQICVWAHSETPYVVCQCSFRIRVLFPSPDSGCVGAPKLNLDSKLIKSRVNAIARWHEAHC